jgi:hypothetical protein
MVCNARKTNEQTTTVLCVVRAVHKRDFRPVINETSNNVNQWKGQAVIKAHVFDRTYIFFRPTVVASLKGL